MLTVEVLFGSNLAGRLKEMYDDQLGELMS